MKRIHVHFGMQKTGSSSIQASLYGKDLGPGHRYVDLGIDNATGPLLNAFMHPDRRLGELRRRGANLTEAAFTTNRKDALKRLRKELDAPHDNLIVSAEGLNHLTEAELRALHDFLEPHADEVRALGYVRPPKAFMQSNFQQLVKGRLGQLALPSLYPGYRERFEKFESVFTRARVDYRLFTPQALTNRCAVQDFCAWLEIPFDPAGVVRVNEGLSRAAVALLFAYRRHADDFPRRVAELRESRLLSEALGKVPGGKLTFHSSLVQPVLEQQREDMLWMQRRLAGSLMEDIKADDATAVTSEADLLTFPSGSVEAVANVFGVQPPAGAASGGAAGMAAVVHALRLKLAGVVVVPGELPAASGLARATRVLKTGPLIEQARQARPAELGNVTPDQGALLLRFALKQVLSQLDSMREGQVELAGFGRFVVHQAQADDESARRKHITFLPVDPRG